MAVSIRQIHPVFVGELSVVDLRRPLSCEEVAAIEAGMYRYAVLVFDDHYITDAQQIAFPPNFADMRAAYDGLDEDAKALVDALVCEHSLMYSRGLLGFEVTPEERAMFRPVRQRLVRSHPVTGRKSLYLASHAGTIVGWPVPEARALLRDLTEHAVQPQFVYVHRWRQYDLVMWDNRQMMHRVRRFDESEIRDMRRTTVAGDAPTVAQ